MDKEERKKERVREYEEEPSNHTQQDSMSDKRCTTPAQTDDLASSFLALFVLLYHLPERAKMDRCKDGCAIFEMPAAPECVNVLTCACRPSQKSLPSGQALGSIVPTCDGTAYPLPLLVTSFLSVDACPSPLHPPL